MSPESSSRIRNWFDFHQWFHIAGAVLDVFRENEAREGGLTAKADTWGLSSPCRRLLHDRARHFWCERSGMDASWWPYSEDFVVLVYHRYRKRNKDEIDQFEREIHLASFGR